ncbi:hypothetical protein [Thiobacillus sp.]
MLLIHHACLRSQEWDKVLTAYCIEYVDCRLMLTPRSIPRVKALRAHLLETFSEAISSEKARHASRSDHTTQ